ncbi:MAG: MBL fold metallo-hydrolase [Saonia sp.]
MVKIAVSEKRNPVPQSYNFGKSGTITTWGAIKVNKSHFFPSSFQIKTQEKVLYIDPVAIESSEKADFIFLTHAHPDHFSIPDIGKLIKPETIIVCPKGVAKKLSKFTNEIKIVTPGDIIQFENIVCEATYAYNTKSVFLWIKAHPKSSDNVGYVITLDKNIQIYHAGDTDYVPELSSIKNIDIAMVPIGGDNLTMNIEEAAKIINDIQPELVIPMHYEMKNSKEVATFKSLINDVIQLETLH